MASPGGFHNWFRYGGLLFSAASSLPLDAGPARSRRVATFAAAAVRRPAQAAALIALVSFTRSERVALSQSLTGEALREYFGERAFRVLPKNRLCRGVLILPLDHRDYVRGHHRQALRTNLRKAATAGISCEVVADQASAIASAMQVLSRGGAPLTQEQGARWRARIERPEMTLLIARDRHGQPLAFAGALIDDAVCLIELAIANDHLARWALHDHLVQYLIARGVRYLFAEGGGTFGALGFATGVRYYQHLLGYQLRHLIPVTDNHVSRARSAASLNPV